MCWLVELGSSSHHTSAGALAASLAFGIAPGTCLVAGNVALVRTGTEELVLVVTFAVVILCLPLSCAPSGREDALVQAQPGCCGSKTCLSQFGPEAVHPLLCDC